MSETNKRLRNSPFYRTGENHSRWIRDRSKLKKQNRIETHHILSWSQNPELRYEVNNGITLCHFHHPRKRNDEMRLSPYFKSLMVKVQ